MGGMEPLADESRLRLCFEACRGISDEDLEKIIAWKDTAADAAAADAANLLLDLGWKVTDKEGTEWT